MIELNQIFLLRQLELAQQTALVNLFNLLDIQRAALGLRERPAAALSDLIEECHTILREIDEREWAICEKDIRDCGSEVRAALDHRSITAKGCAK